MAYYIPGTWKSEMGETYWYATDCGYTSDANIISKYDGILPQEEGLERNADADGDVLMHSAVEESPTEVMFRKKDLKDEELDKKIEALRKKNEALMKRYQEVEEDKKRAEEEGMGLQSRKGRTEDLTITISKSITDTRVVTKKSGCGDTGNPKAAQEAADPDENPFGVGRGKRRQLLVTMAGNIKGKRTVCEKMGQNLPTIDLTETGDSDSTRSGRHLLPSKPDTRPQEDERRQGLAEESHWLTECDPYYKDVEGFDSQGHPDLTKPTSREEQLEYLRWKKEREQIDRERVARHKNAKGQWRRAWDMDKSENMFRDGCHGESERGNKTRGTRNARRGHSRANSESQGHPYRSRDEGKKNLPAVSSKAKGKDRLTGRARRWDAKEEGDHSQQTMETNLEEFLEELDAFVGPELNRSPKPKVESEDGEVEKGLALHSGTVGADDVRPDEAVDGGDPKRGGSVLPQPDCHSGDNVPALDGSSGAPVDSQGDQAPKSRRVSEKKVRFSEDTTKETKLTKEVAPSPIASASEMTAAIKQRSYSRGSPSAVVKEAKQTLASGLNAPEGDGIQKQDWKVTNLPHSKAPVNGVLVDGHINAHGPEDTSKSGRVSEKPSIAQGLTSEPEMGQITAEKDSATLLQESTHQPLKHCKSTRSPEEIIDSSFCAMSLDSGAPHPYPDTSSAKIKENGKIV
ncbi:hypothetical protein GJAV_G00012220 [Gymnothorax javanicus]|nr:hypothetical protein GJAV_G00012220 [Gymnothorax javanicus]